MYILGPCSAESRDQVMETARQIIAVLGETTPFIFRAGVWKPRTSPDTFQGAGEEALAWLQEVKETFGVPVATEVATPEHVEKACLAGIDYLWIGARTSANPIAVQGIADAIDRFAVRPLHCKTANAERPASPVGLLIKNPVNHDADLWLGNIERLERTGVEVVAVHRGCGHKPCWSMAHKVREARPDIKLLLDPSHMSGDAAKVPELMGKIEDLGLDGAMIEVHCCPEKALSDKKQQILPSCLRDTLVPIPCRFRVVSVFSTSKSPEELNWLRAEIDELDDALWESLAARMEVSQRIGTWKKAHGVAPLQPERYAQILNARKEWANKSGMDAAFVERVFNLIHAESLKAQE